MLRGVVPPRVYYHTGLLSVAGCVFLRVISFVGISVNDLVIGGGARILGVVMSQRSRDAVPPLVPLFFPLNYLISPSGTFRTLGRIFRTARVDWGGGVDSWSLRLGNGAVRVLALGASEG